MTGAALVRNGHVLIELCSVAVLPHDWLAIEREHHRKLEKGESKVEKKRR
jgi:hypothetical protein